MSLKVHHPRLLIMVLLLVVGVTSASVLMARSQPEPPVFPDVPVNSPLSADEEEKAVEIARESGIVKSINGDQDWEAKNTYRTKIEGTESVIFVAEWDDPVESSGPWSLVRCKGSRKLVVESEISNITLLAVYVDMEAESVAGWSVDSPSNTEASQVLSFQYSSQVIPTPF